jgi:hypothetical protein
MGALPRAIELAREHDVPGTILPGGVRDGVSISPHRSRLFLASRLLRVAAITWGVHYSCNGGKCVEILVAAAAK